MKNVRARNGVVFGFCVLSIVALTTAFACSSRQGQSPNGRGDIRTERSALAGAQPDQSTVPASENRLAAGTGFNCMILGTGALKCWGDNHDFQLGIGPGGNRGDEPGEMGSMLPAVSLGTGLTARSVAAGTSEACALLSDSTVKCWGRNIFGALGIDAPPFGSQPGAMGDQLPRVPLGRKVRSLVAGADSFFCALLETGDVKCWGRNTFGQLGVGDMLPRGGSTGTDSVENTPTVDLGVGRTATSLAAGVDHACAILENGDVKCWGSNEGISGGGQLGTGDAYNRGDIRADPHHQMGDALPIVPLGTGLKAIALVAGRAHTCARLNNGSVKCWGENESGQLGIGTAPTGSTILGDGLLPVNLGAGRSARSLVAGPDHTCAILDNGIVKCWGNNGSGQLGIESTSNQGDAPATIGDPDPIAGTPGMRPVALGTLRTARALAAGGMHTCAWLDDGSVKCWGGNGNGESGVGLSAVQYGKAPGTMGDKLMAVHLRQSTSSSALSNHKCAVLDDGSVKCWGYDTDGQLGIGETSNSRGAFAGQMGTYLPRVHLGTGRTALAVATGRAHSCALLDDYSVKCWGANEHGQLGQNSNVTIGNAGGPESLDTLFSINLGPGRTALSIAVGGDTSCAVLDNATLKCWGSSNNYQLGNGSTTPLGYQPGEMSTVPTIPVGAGRSVKAVSVSWVHVCALLDNGWVKCWGSNQFGQLGIGNTTSYLKTPPANPVLPPGDVAVSVSAGAAHTCALLTTGVVKCWGKNLFGQLGIDSTTNQGWTSAPILPAALGTTADDIAVSVVAGNNHTCALLRTGTVRCWGYNGYGETGPVTINTNANLGDEPNEMEAHIEVALGTAASAVDIYSGGNSTCALLSDGRQKCWGLNVYGELGLGYRNANNAIGYVAAEMGDALPTTQLGADRPALSVAAGDFFSCAILENGPVKCWGKNESGQLGLGDTNPRGILPTQLGSSLLATLLGSGRSARMLAAGGNHACALLDNGNVKCWGANASGQLGIGNKDNRGVGGNQMNDNLPIVPLGTGRTAVAITAGTAHSCALLDDNTVKCWGANAQGQLGLGTTDPRGDDPNELGDAPRSTVALGFSARSIAADRNHTCALLDNGTVKCWGENANGELGVGKPGNMGDIDGELGESLPVVDLGTTTPGSNPPGPLHTPILVAPSCAVLENGQLKCWGDNTIGQLGLGNSDPHGLAPEQLGDNLHIVDLGLGRTVLGLAARNRHKCAILDDSSIKCWGDNASGQLGLGVPNNKGASLADMGDNLFRVDLGTPRTAQRVTVGATHTCAVLDNGTVKCWGYNADGELGIGTTTPHGSGAGQMGGNLPIVSTGDTDPWNGGTPIATGQCAPATVVDDGNACTTDGCDPAVGVTHSPICSATCPCATGHHICTSNVDCGGESVCGQDNGAFFDRLRSDDVCWSPICTANVLTECGAPNAICGTSCSAAKSCNNNQDCPSGEVCGINNGLRFSNELGNRCWRIQCETDPVTAGCGTIFSPCGKCQCAAKCGNAQCGGDTSDGCGGHCASVCADRAPGCTRNTDCQPGSVCIFGGGPRVGLAAGTNVCLPADCSELDPKRMGACGSPSSHCGTCPPCVPDCTERTCGLDPRCGVSCGSCDDGATCTDSGSCVVPALDDSVTVPDGLGGQRDVPNLTPPLTQGVGPIAGDFSVSDRGTAVYTIPIVVPPGRNGLEPELRLRYESTKENGILGVGWVLEGLSMISRCPKTVRRDGWYSSDLYASDAKYCIDGQRLVLVRGIDDTEGAEYRTELDTFRNVKLHKISDQPGPDWFQVRTRDGKILEYGHRRDASIYREQPGRGSNTLPEKRAWALSQVQDSAGTYMTISYQGYGVPPVECPPASPDEDACSTQEFLPSRITYGGYLHAGVSYPAHRTIEFKYSSADRVDRLKGYGEGGVPIERTHLLEAITISAQDLGFRYYDLQYTESPAKTNQLSSVTECAASIAEAPVCKRPTTFHYNDASSGFTGPIDAGIASTDSAIPPYYGAQVLDWNGDGRDDIVVTRRNVAHDAEPLLQVYSAARESAPVFDGHDTGIAVTEFSHIEFGDIGLHRETWLELWHNGITDYDRDGRDDLLVLQGQSGINNVPKDREVYSLLALHSENSSPYLYRQFPSTPPPQTDLRSATLIDANGDGLGDIVNDGPSGLQLLLQAAPPSQPLPTYNTVAPIGPSTYINSDMVFDDHGDGFLRLFGGHCSDGQYLASCGLNISGPTTASWGPGKLTVIGSTKVVDINADGAPDFLELLPSDTDPPEMLLRAHLNRRNGTFAESGVQPPGSGTFTWDVANFSGAIAIDYDGDGREDLISPGPNTATSGQWILHRNTPTERSKPYEAFETAQPISLVRTYQFHDHPDYSTVIGDFNGDGRKDLGAVDADGHLKIFFGRNRLGGLLSSIDNGEGKITEVNYDMGTADNPTYKSIVVPGEKHICEWPTNCLRRIDHPLVSSHTMGQQTGITSPVVREKYLYHYSDARMGATGDGWLGFGHRTIEHLDGELKSIEKTDIDYDNGKGTFKESLNLFPTAGRVLAIRRTGSGDAVSLPLAGSASEVVDTSYTWAVGTSDAQAVGTSEAHLPFVYLQSTQTTFSEVPHQSGPSPVYFTSNSVEQIDEYGNVHARALQWGAPSNGATQIVATRGIGTTFELTPSRIENWQISLPQEVTTIDTRGGESRTHQSVSTYDEFGRLETSYDRERKLLTTIARTPSGAVESVSDADDQGNIRRISMTYDARELFPRVLRDAFENETQLLFDEATGQIATRADPNGVVEQWAYDRFGRIRRYVSPGQDIRTDYEEVGEDATGPIPVLARTRVETTVVNGPHSTRDLDPLGRLVRTITSGLNGLNISQEAQYNAQGQVQRRARPHLPGDGTQGIVDYAYDERNRLVSEMQPDGATTNYAYATPVSLDPGYAGFLRGAEAVAVRATTRSPSRTDPTGSQTITFFDMFGNPITALDEMLFTTQYTYGPGNLLERVEDAAHNIATMARDPVGRVLEQHDPDMGNQVYTYTAFGEVKTHIDGNQILHTYNYDALGRLFLAYDADGPTVWTYGTGPNEIGRLMETTSPTGHRTKYGYEPPTAAGNRGFLTTIEQSAEPGPVHVEFHYDANTSLLDRITYPEAGGRSFAIVQGYDMSGNLTSVTDATTGVPYWQLLGADQGFRIAHERLGNGTDTTRDYYPLNGRINHIRTLKDANVRQDLSYEYYPHGNVRVRQDLALGQGGRTKETFEYDPMDRLRVRRLPAGAGGGAEQTDNFDYDSLGNIALASGLGVYSYNNGRPHAVSDVGDNSYGYDGNGNLEGRVGPGIPGGMQAFAYTAFNLPKSVATGSSGDLTTFEYNAGGQRVLKRDSTGESIYIADLYERRAPVTLQDPTEHVYRIFAGGREIAQVQRSVQGSTVPPDKILYLHDDALGSTNAITDSGGNATYHQRFAPFGRSENSGAEATGIRIGFTGHESDAALGLVNMRGRLYDPMIGRFTTPDPITQNPYWSQGLNRYSYTWNNFLKWVDPSGFDSSSAPGSDSSDTPPIQPPVVDTINGTPPTESVASDTQSIAPEEPVANYGPPPGVGGEWSTADAQSTSDYSPSSSAAGEIAPLGLGAPRPGTLLNRQEFKVVDTSETWKITFQIEMALVPVGEGGGLIEAGAMIGSRAWRSAGGFFAAGRAAANVVADEGGYLAVVNAGVGDSVATRSAEAVAALRGEQVTTLSGLNTVTGGGRLTVVAHGAELASVGVENVATAIKASGTPFSSIELLSCSGGSGRAAATLARQTGLVVKGYLGPVTVLEPGSMGVARVLHGPILLPAGQGARVFLPVVP